jgi:hypothetical protein
MSYGNIQTQTYDLMMQAINEESQWLLHTTKQGVNTLKMTKKPEVSSVVYLILRSGHEASNIVTDLIYQLVDLEGKEPLNKRASFFLVMTDSFEFPKKLAEEMIEKLWTEYKILDVLLLIPVASHALQTEGSINDGKSVFKFYTRFPFHSSGNEVVLIDEFFVATEVETLHNSNLFPNKIPRKFQNQNTLLTMTTQIKPTTLLVSKTTDEVNKTHLEFKGAEIDIFKLILQHLNLTYVYKYYGPVTYGIFKDLVTGNFDILFGSTPLHQKLLAYGEPSISYYETGYKWYVPCAASIPRLKKISQIFSPTVWMLIIITFAAIITVMWLLVQCRDVTEIKDYRTVSGCAYNAWATAMGVSASKPSTTAIKTLFFLWVCYCYSISTVFETFFTSFLVNPGFGTQIENFKDLLSSGLEYGYDIRFYESFYKRNNSDEEMSNDFKPSDCTDTETCLLRVVNDKDFATLQVEYMAMYFATIYLPKGSLLCSMRDKYRAVRTVMYFPTGSHFLIPINGVIRRIIEAGFIKKFVGDMIELWKIQKDSHAVRDFVVKDNSVEDYFVFNLSHLQIAFWSLAVGLCLSTFCLLLEIVCFRLGVVK